jgi:hypothetical protein
VYHCMTLHSVHQAYDLIRKMSKVRTPKRRGSLFRDLGPKSRG